MDSHPIPTSIPTAESSWTGRVLAFINCNGGLVWLIDPSALHLVLVITPIQCLPHCIACRLKWTWGYGCVCVFSMVSSVSHFDPLNKSLLTSPFHTPLSLYLSLLVHILFLPNLIINLNHARLHLAWKYSTFLIIKSILHVVVVVLITIISYRMMEFVFNNS